MLYDVCCLGGMYWTICLVIGQLTSFVAVYLYSVLGASGSVASVASLWYLVCSLELAFVLFFAIFLLSINKKYIGTFFATVTGKHFTAQRFREAGGDRAKNHVFAMHPAFYAAFRGEVKLWVGENFNKWNEEKPEWFNERLMANIPSDMIPRDETMED